MTRMPNDSPRRRRSAARAGLMSVVVVAAPALAASGCGSDVPPLPKPRAPAVQPEAQPEAPAGKKAARRKMKYSEEDSSFHLRRQHRAEQKTP